MPLLFFDAGLGRPCRDRQAHWGRWGWAQRRYSLPARLVTCMLTKFVPSPRIGLPSNASRTNCQIRTLGRLSTCHGPSTMVSAWSFGILDNQSGQTATRLLNCYRTPLGNVVNPEVGFSQTGELLKMAQINPFLCVGEAGLKVTRGRFRLFRLKKKIAKWQKQRELPLALFLSLYQAKRNTQFAS